MGWPTGIFAFTALSASLVALSSSVPDGGGPGCFGFGVLTYELCCFGSPQAHLCWDDFFTPERCCDQPVAGPGGILARLRDELFTDVNPYSLLDSPCGVPYMAQANRYPDSHMTAALVRQVLGFVADPVLWVEVGSFIGTSAITTAASLKAMNLSTGIVCIDPFTGVSDMWSTRKAFRARTALRNRPIGSTVADGPLLMDEFGHSRIYEVFLSNVRHAGHQDIVMPLPVSSVTGMRLLRELHRDGRLEKLPQVIYLDSAHEPDETLLEVREAWRLLAAPGILFGDDWSWPGVRSDVAAFAGELQLRSFTAEELWRFDGPTKAADQPVPGLAVVDAGDGVWLMLKE